MVGTGSVWPGYGPSVVVLVGCLCTSGPVTRHRWGGGAWQETQNPSLLGLLAVVCCCFFLRLRRKIALRRCAFANRCLQNYGFNTPTFLFFPENFLERKLLEGGGRTTTRNKKKEEEEEEEQQQDTLLLPKMGDHQDPVILASYGSHKGGANAVQFRPHMKHVVSGGADFAVLLWSLHCRTNLRYPIVRPYRFLGHQVTRLSSFLPSCSSCGLLSFVLSEILSSTAASI